jgi:8-oxo-dGTP diphosphatase
MIDRFAVVPASYLFLLRDGSDGPVRRGGTEVLLQRRGEVPYMAGHWAAAAAGHVEKGETAHDAARREAAEEIGVTDPDLAIVTVMQRTGGDDPINERIDFFFTARRWQGEPAIREPRKATHLGWFPLDDLPAPLVPHEAAVLRMIRTGVAEPYTTFGFATAG